MLKVLLYAKCRRSVMQILAMDLNNVTNKTYENYIYLLQNTMEKNL